MIYRDKTTGWYYMLNDSDNYGFDCYSFNEKKEQQDGFIPFAVDICDTCHGLTQEEVAAERALIEKWPTMTEPEQVDYCLQEMDTSLENCELLEDEDLEEELWDKC